MDYNLKSSNTEIDLNVEHSCRHQKERKEKRCFENSAQKKYNYQEEERKDFNIEKEIQLSGRRKERF